MVSALRFVFRVLHMSTVILWGGQVIADFFSGPIVYSHPTSLLFGVSGVVLILSGLVNLILLKPKATMGSKHVLWSTLIKFKFLLSLALTPLLDRILFLVNKKELKVMVQFGCVVVSILISCYMRYFREEQTLVRPQPSAKEQDKTA
eukprot:GILK01008700.1.p1 GENE.GILK01008700.1~~GILK01008700.1.p1  ORF type:complete len:147 (+),score=13.85 GILK01008700.1:42-482(+)